jgi:hypothetical protein
VRYVIAALAGVIGLALGWIVAAFAFLGIGSLVGVSDFEGQRAMMAFFAAGPVGGAVGLIGGIWASWRLRAGRRPTLLTLVIAAALLVLAASKVWRLQHLVGGA